MVRKNPAKQKLMKGLPVAAITVSPPHPSLVEQAGLLGFDCVIIDGEHGPINDGQLEDMVRAAELTETSCGVRLCATMPITGLLQRYLEAGVSTVQITQLHSAAEAREIIDAVKYPPLGKRGMGPNSRIFGFGGSRPVDYRPLMESRNDEMLVVVSVEDEPGVQVLPSILEVEGIDVVIVGVMDLSSSLGRPGETRHPSVTAIVSEVTARVAEAERWIGKPANGMPEAEAAIQSGALFVLTSTPRALAAGAVGIVQAVRGEMASSAGSGHR
jgi:4-hydroxy-2-oxoheptanedioate aldolase